MYKIEIKILKDGEETGCKYITIDYRTKWQAKIIYDALLDLLEWDEVK